MASASSRLAEFYCLFESGSQNRSVRSSVSASKEPSPATRFFRIFSQSDQNKYARPEALIRDGHAARTENSDLRVTVCLFLYFETALRHKKLLGFGEISSSTFPSISWILLAPKIRFKKINFSPSKFSKINENSWFGTPKPYSLTTFCYNIIKITKNHQKLHWYYECYRFGDAEGKWCF